MLYHLFCSAKEKDAFRSALFASGRGLRELFEGLSKLRIQDAQASVPHDKEHIMQTIDKAAEATGRQGRSKTAGLKCVYHWFEMYDLNHLVFVGNICIIFFNASSIDLSRAHESPTFQNNPLNWRQCASLSSSHLARTSIGRPKWPRSTKVSRKNCCSEEIHKASQNIQRITKHFSLCGPN